MSWRIVVVSNRCKLDLKMGYMVIRGEETKRIFLDEIAIILIENPAVAMTGCLLEKLTEKKIRVIFCNAKRSPISELVPLHGSYDTPRKVRQQLAWSETIKGAVWSAIVADKISKQMQHLEERKMRREAMLLNSYLHQIEFQDETNREGHAAKVYFNAIIGMEFSRHDEQPINAALNYGYTILLSAFNREISAAGYITELGIHHDNVFNHFNLSSDLMEPFRILVDRKVCEIMPGELDRDTKYLLVNILNETVRIDNSQQTVLNAIRIYLRRVFDALNQEDLGLLQFYQI